MPVTLKKIRDKLRSIIQSNTSTQEEVRWARKKMKELRDKTPNTPNEDADDLIAYISVPANVELKELQVAISDIRKVLPQVDRNKKIQLRQLFHGLESSPLADESVKLYVEKVTERLPDVGHSKQTIDSRLEAELLKSTTDLPKLKRLLARWRADQE